MSPGRILWLSLGALLVILAAVLVVGCSDGDPATDNPYNVITVNVENRSVTCVVFGFGGASCDWEHATPPVEPTPSAIPGKG